MLKRVRGNKNSYMSPLVCRWMSCGYFCRNVNAYASLLSKRQDRDFPSRSRAKGRLRRLIKDGEVKLSDTYCVLMSLPVRNRLERQAHYLHSEYSNPFLGCLNNIEDELMYPDRYRNSIFSRNAKYNNGNIEDKVFIPSFENKRRWADTLYSKYNDCPIKYPNLMRYST